MWNLKYDASELIYKTETDSDKENKVTVGKEESEDQFKEFGINRYIVLYLKETTGTYRIAENSIKYLLINYNGKEYEK